MTSFRELLFNLNSWNGLVKFDIVMKSKLWETAKEVGYSIWRAKIGKWYHNSQSLNKNLFLFKTNLFKNKQKIYILNMSMEFDKSHS